VENIQSVCRSKLPLKKPDWPDMYNQAYTFDRLEIGGETFNSGYAIMYDQRRRATLKALVDLTPAGAQVLDLAAAGGNFSIAAARLGYDVIWNDLREDMIDYVKAKVPEGVNLSYVADNILNLSEEYHERFQTVMALEVVEHVAYPDQFIAKIAKTVKSGGHIIMTTPNGAYFRNNLPRYSDFPDPSVFEEMQFQPNSDGHIFLLYEDELRRFGEAAGVNVLKYEQFTNPLSAGHIKLRHLHKIIPNFGIAAVEKISKVAPNSVKSRLMSSSLVVYQKP